MGFLKKLFGSKKQDYTIIDQQNTNEPYRIRVVENTKRFMGVPIYQVFHRKGHLCREYPTRSQAINYINRRVRQ